jgi:phospholipid/cholesterol/gamma-HCH transport system substrate-binding protein
MRKRAQKIRLGIFLTISIGILFFILVFFTARKFFEKEDIYFVAYENVSVSGLEVGSPVKYLGIKVGSIRDIIIDPENVASVILELSLKPATPIKEDAVAEIATVGITGLKTIEIHGGSNEAAFLEPESYINAGSSITEEITGKAEIIAEKVEKVLNNLQDFTEPDNLNKITEMAENISSLALQANESITRIDTVVMENRVDIRETISGFKDITNRLDQSSRVFTATIEKIHKMVESDTLGEILGNVRDVSLKLKEADIQSLIENLTMVASQTQELLKKVDSDLDQSSQDFSESIRLLKMTLENLLETSRKINNDPSIILRGVEQKNTPDDDLKN